VETLRKIRKELLNNLNKERKNKDNGPLYLELMTNKVAMDYAAFLNNNDHNPKFWENL